MKKSKANPRKPSLKDLQGHTYQHEVGDPDWQKSATAKQKGKQKPQSERVPPTEQTEHGIMRPKK